MSHTIIYNPETYTIEMEIQGDLTLNEIKEIFAELALIVKEKNCTLLLNDYRDATVRLSTMEIYGLPKIISEIYAASGINVHQLKRALVVEKSLDDFQFFESVTFNNAQNAKLFYDIDEAKKWLFGK